MDLDTDDSDPVTATYPVFLNPSLPEGRRLLVLQQPNRTDANPRPPPTEIRLKPTAGMVEVDVPVDSAPGIYDREKGLHWGRALHASTTAKSGGSHGIAGGFGLGSVQQRGGGGGGSAAAKKKAELLEESLDWNEAVRQGKVLHTQTLGGQFPDSNDVQYMVGVFQGKNLHLTPVSSLVHLRPQLHHIDAAFTLDRQSGSKDASSGAGGGANVGGAAGSGGALGSGSGGPGGGARAIHMTIKTTADGESVTTETIADRLRLVQTEQWHRLRYTDENAEAAWDVYNESLFLRPKDGEQPQPIEGTGSEEDTLRGAVPAFATHWGDKELLEAVSGIKKPEPEPKPEEAAVQQTLKLEQPVEEPKRPAATRTRGGATRGSRRGAARGKGPAGRGGSSAIQLD